MNYVLDSCILGKICHPNAEQNRKINEWLQGILISDEHTVCIPEIVDYELRRQLIHLALKAGTEKTKSLDRLDSLEKELDYIPLNTEIMHDAASMWAKARKQGIATADDKSLDADVILAAQAKTVSGVVITTNTKHLSRFVAVKEIDTK